MSGVPLRPVADLTLPELSILFLDLAHRSLRRQAGAPACESLLAALLPFAGNGALGIDVPRLRPIAERIAVPWRLRCERRQLKLLPNRARPLHEFARGQGERGGRMFQRRVDEQA